VPHSCGMIGRASTDRSNMRRGVARDAVFPVRSLGSGLGGRGRAKNVRASANRTRLCARSTQQRPPDGNFLAAVGLELSSNLFPSRFLCGSQNGLSGSRIERKDKSKGCSVGSVPPKAQRSSNLRISNWKSPFRAVWRNQAMSLSRRGLLDASIEMCYAHNRDGCHATRPRVAQTIENVVFACQIPVDSSSFQPRQ